jgi:Adenine-specific DNA methylase
MFTHLKSINYNWGGCIIQTTLYGDEIKIDFPTTRYWGSKRKLIGWIWDELKKYKFKTVLDAFGGTGTVSYTLKKHKKSVTYNDILQSNYQIGLSLIENNNKKLDSKDIAHILTKHKIDYPDFIQKTFRDIYYTELENEWLDMVITNIHDIENKYKKH